MPALACSFLSCDVKLSEPKCQVEQYGLSTVVKTGRVPHLLNAATGKEMSNNPYSQHWLVRTSPGKIKQANDEEACSRSMTVRLRVFNFEIGSWGL